MKKSTKVIATVIAVTLVITAMLVAIYAATAGNANISANVSWTAQAGVNLEFWAKATGGDESKEIAKTTITPTTTNTDANIIGDLSCNFTDTTDDGVNNPNAIKFTYYVRNKSLTPLNIRVTKTPAEAEESGTGAENHKPKVTLNSETDGTSTLTAVSSTLGYDLKAGDIFTYSVTLSLAKGGTGTINADFGLAPNFDAGVTFNFNVGGNSKGTIVTSVDGATPTTVSSSTLAGQTLGEYLATQQTAEYSTGWFFDEGLTKVVSDDYLNDSLKDSSISSFYCKTAGIEGLSFALSDDSNSYLVSAESATSPSGEVVIPNTYNGKPVSGFVEGAYSSHTFKDNTNITCIVIPNSITKIPDFTFTNCENITTVNISNVVTRIGSNTFTNCTSLIDVKIPISITLLLNSFDCCTGLKSIIVEGGNEKYDSRNNCNAIIESSSNRLKLGCMNTIIPSTVESIGDGAFKDCIELTNIKIPNGVTKIGSNAFNGCSGLKNIEIPKSVTSLGNATFARCSGLISIIIPSSVKSMGFMQFTGCSELASIVVETGNIVYDSRDNCNAIIETASNTLIQGCKNTIIPQTITIIGESAFNGCSGLMNVDIPQCVTSIGNLAFNNCISLTSIKLPNSVTTLGKSVFRDCAGLTSIEMSNTVTSINQYTFSGCSRLLDINIPEGVTSIGMFAFQDCSSLSSVIIPESVTDIGRSAFQNCTNLRDITISDTVTHIAISTFKNCSNLSRIFIPKSVTTIYSGFYGSINSPFEGCPSTLKIYCEATEKPSGWGDYWNYYDDNNQLDVTWGYTRAQFDAL